MIGKITEIIGQPQRDCIYDILRYLDLGLCLDIGAAAGHVTRTLCHVGGGKTKVVAFEPFPDNHQYFYKTIEGLDNDVRLVKKAVSDSAGTSRFIVGSVVQGTEPDWQKYSGYSSVGFLSPAYGARYLKSKIQSIFSAVFKRPGTRILDVKTTTIDMEFPNEVINFIKMDVQGAEEKVLQGASTALEENRINVLYIEWSGEQGVTDILVNHGYQIYDSTYVVGPKTYDTQPFEDIGFRDISRINLSTGKTAYEMILADDNVSPAEAIREVKNRGLGWIQTDLIAINSNVKEQFLEATRKYIEAHHAGSAEPVQPELTGNAL